MPQDDLIRLLPAILPRFRKWVADTVCAAHGHAESALSVADPALSACFPKEFLERARVVVCADVPRPPIVDYGLAKFGLLGEGPLNGIALGSTYFIGASANEPALHFHELVHVAQWQRLGTDNFLMAYGVGLAIHGYHENPLELLANHLQLEFCRGIRRMRLIAEIERHTDAIWGDARQHLAAASIVTAQSIHSDWITGRY